MAKPSANDQGAKKSRLASGRSRLSRWWRKIGVFLLRYESPVATATLALLLAGLGWVVVQWRELAWKTSGGEVVNWQEMGMDGLQGFSYDVPFVVRYSLPNWLQPVAGAYRPVDEVVLVYMDEESTRSLGLPPGAPWSRALHAKLVNRLADDGARAVMFDVIFDSTSTDDAEFGAALARQGKVILGAGINSNSDVPLTADVLLRLQQVGMGTEQLTKRPPLYKAARGWGLLTFRPLEADYSVRRLFTGKQRDGLDPWMAASWQLARITGAQLPEDEAGRFERRWINYYGPAHYLPSISYARVLAEQGDVPAGFFRDKVVIIGGRWQVGSSPDGLRDAFGTPWSRSRGEAVTPGAEIHATMYLNLLRHEWLSRVPEAVERWGVVAFGLLLGLLRLLRPWRAVIVSLTLALSVFVIACFMQWHARVWWNWAVPVLWQIPVAAVLTVASRYYIEERKGRKMRTALSIYVAPELAAQIAETNFSLAPGGRKLVATLMFTDLANYTTLAERLGDSARLGEELVRYFTRTTDEIFAENGTVIKFVGDCVFASWNNFLPQPDHAERAVRAAWRVAEVSAMEVAVTQADGTMETVPIYTRIGLHTGEVLAGNLGSERRVDYTLIGDAVNFASRLEGANKYTGTGILLSDDTAQRLGGKFLLRKLGAFLVKGKTKAVVIHELLGLDAAARPDWMDVFEQSLAHWTAGRLEEAKAGFLNVKELREGSDGPSEFYLQRIAKATIHPNWTGDVALEDK